MGAEHTVDPTNDRDEMSRAGVLVILELDGLGLPVVKVSTGSQPYVRIDTNNVTIHEVAPNAEQRAAIVAAHAAAEAARSDTDRLTEAIGARVGASSTPAEIAAIAVEESAKLAQSV